jgi:hypothetical protein
MTIKLERPVVYVTRDIERALGIDPEGLYSVISNDTPYGRAAKEAHPGNVRLIAQNSRARDTFDLLALPEVRATIKELGAAVAVFQNTSRIERIAEEEGIELLNPKASLSKSVEEKISQIEFLGKDSSLLPPFHTAPVKDVEFSGKRFVLQFNHSHTGQGTYIIDSETELKRLRSLFPERECRVLDFVDGPVFTANVVVGDKVLVGNPSYQITGLAPYTDLPFSTIGNDWALPHAPRYAKALADIEEIARKVGARMKKAGWRGLFGIDAIHDEASGATYLLEINARQPASAVFESSLQRKASAKGATVFEAHLLALLGMPLPESLIPVTRGAQVVKRVTTNEFSVDAASLRAKGLAVIEYENDLHNKELFRIQSSAGIMESHGSWNVFGALIASCIKPKGK